MKTIENKNADCNTPENKKNYKLKFFLGMVAGIILYVSYQIFIK